jgi:hypothetical protein
MRSRDGDNSGAFLYAFCTCNNCLLIKFSLEPARTMRLFLAEQSVPESRYEVGFK